MRREGYEMEVSRPEIVVKEVGACAWSRWRTGVDVPELYQGVVIAQVSERRGDDAHGQPRSGRVRLEFRIPPAG